MFNIEKNVEVADVTDRVSWPWRNMDIGDSVLFGPDLAAKAQLRCHVYGYKYGMKFVTRKVDGGLRVWRTA